MINPIKLIYKYKNNNKRKQYALYIYLGKNIDDDTLTILKQITYSSFIEALEKLSVKNEKHLSKVLGLWWYKSIFIIDHLDNEISRILKIKVLKDKFIGKYGLEWFNNHLGQYQTNKKNITVSYASKVNFYKSIFSKKKEVIIKKDVIDFSTNNLLIGGDDNSKNPDSENPDSEDYQSEEVNEEELSDIEEEVNLDIMDQNYDIEDKEITDTAKLISEAINDKSWKKKVESNSIEFKTDNDNLTYDMSLKDVYIKNYVTEYYLYMDDTIRTIKNKICNSIKLNNKFNNIDYVVPSRQYLWINYTLNNQDEKKIEDKIMLGQKWMKRNEVIKIDIEPNDNFKIYEKLKGNLNYLKDYKGTKIKREEDEYNILNDYIDYLDNNEIIMIDIYNDLGLNYNILQMDKNNFFEVYVNIYYPKLSFDDYEGIISYLNGNTSNESTNVNKIINVLRNEVKLDKEVTDLISEYKIKKELYQEYFKDNYILQSIIHVNLIDDSNITGTINDKLNLYRIFDSFIVDEIYPFVQYQTQDTKLIYKFYKNTDRIEDKEVLSKWFENAPYGISFKIKRNDLNTKYISINLHETSRIEYKITFKENNKAVLNDVLETYDIVRQLIKKINTGTKKINIIIPNNERFKFAFINTIQQFTLPPKMKISHNDLSEFARYFSAAAVRT